MPERPADRGRVPLPTALLTHLPCMMGAGWGIVLSSLAFGLLHIATNVHDLGLAAADWSAWNVR